MPSSTSSSRWCPTSEQLMILEEMYKEGTRTPNAGQIQQITARLSRYGKIEGKNVFYWFQNHKARDRQRLRRKLMSKQLHLHNYHQFHIPNPQFPLGFLGFPPVSHYTPLGFLPQGSRVETSAAQVMDNSLSRTYGGDCMIMLDVGPTTSTYCKKPPKTLELFPITATGLEAERIASNQNPFTNPMY